MKRKVLTSICCMLMLLAFSTLAYADTGESAEETPLLAGLYRVGAEWVSVGSESAGEISLSIDEGTELELLFDEEGINKATVQAVSGGAVEYHGPNLFGEEFDLSCNGDGRMVLTLFGNQISSLTPGEYQAVIPAGLFTGVQSTTGKLFKNSELVINVIVLAEREPYQLDTPQVRLENNRLTWNLVEGAYKYEVTYYKDGVQPPNGHVTIPADLSDPYNYLDIRKNFPMEAGSVYTVKVIACPEIGSLNTESAAAELLLREALPESERISPPTNVHWEENAVDHALTMLVTDKGSPGRRQFIRLYKDDKLIKIHRYYEGNVKNFSDKMQMVKPGTYYVEICAIDINEFDRPASIWVKSPEVVVEDNTEQQQEAINKALSGVTDNMTEKQINQIVKELEETGIQSLNTVLAENENARANYEKLEEAAQKAYGVTVDTAIDTDKIPAGPVKVAGLAMNAVSGSAVKLQIKEPLGSSVVSYLEVNQQTAVELDIEVPGITSFTHPILITMPIPENLSAEKLVILHIIRDEAGNYKRQEKISPIINSKDRTMTFSVTHFSTFVFGNTEEKEDDTDDGDDDKHVSYSYSSSSSARTIGLMTYGSAKKFVKANGQFAVNEWVRRGNTWYYAGANGELLTGWYQNAAGTWYYLKDNCEMATGWQLVNGQWYYLDRANGDMKTGWLQTEDGKWYFMRADGDMKTGWLRTADDKWYYLGADGACLMSTTTPDGYRVDENGAWIR